MRVKYWTNKLLVLLLRVWACAWAFSLSFQLSIQQGCEESQSHPSKWPEDVGVLLTSPTPLSGRPSIWNRFHVCILIPLILSSSHRICTITCVCLFTIATEIFADRSVASCSVISSPAKNQMLSGKTVSQLSCSVTVLWVIMVNGCVYHSHSLLILSVPFCHASCWDIFNL